ncbi:24184_t:CDS:2, partial [Gigaspora rosea]
IYQIFIWNIRTIKFVQTLQGPYENLVALAQHSIQPIINLAFKEIHDNIAYEEREDEFDIVNEEVQSEQYNKNQNLEDEDEEIDVVTTHLIMKTNLLIRG